MNSDKFRRLIQAISDLEKENEGLRDMLDREDDDDILEELAMYIQANEESLSKAKMAEMYMFTELVEDYGSDIAEA